MKKILLVDDNPRNLQVLANALSGSNYDIEIAENGQEAVDIVAGEPFDLILMDIMMPVMSGFDACKEIKTMKNRSDIPIIFLTAISEDSSITRGFDAGGVDYIKKPFNQKELLARVNTHIELKEGKDRLKNLNLVLEQKVELRTNELRQAKEEIEILDAAKTEFLDIISHEIRTPLNGIMGFIDLLNDSVIDEKGKRFLSILEKSTKRLEDFSLKALEITQLKTNNNALLNKENCYFSEIIDTSIVKLESKIKERKITLNKKIDKFMMHVDRIQISRCINSILDNAIYHAPVGGEVSINSIVDGDNFVTVIADNGSGFPDSILKNGIKPFITHKHINSNPGLELYLSKLIIKAHKGSLSINNDNGAKVTISLPINKTDL